MELLLIIVVVVLLLGGGGGFAARRRWWVRPVNVAQPGQPPQQVNVVEHEEDRPL
jgi:hypothetical protein